MNFALGIVIYLLIFFVLLYAFAKCGMGLFSALTITVLISAILLLAIIPPSEIEHQIDLYFSDRPHKKANDYIVLIYLLILILSLILISAYIIFKAYEDRNRRLKIHGEDYLCDFNTYLKFW
jgi:hypothetical protein